MNNTEEKGFNPLKKICKIDPEYHHLGKERIEKEFYFCEEKRMRRKSYLIQYRYFIDEDWWLWQQAFEQEVYMSKEDKYELDTGGYR